MTPDDRAKFTAQLADPHAEALTAYAEARNQPTMGLVAVIAVIRNRARIKGTRSAEQAFKKAAFSCWLDLDDDNSRKMNGLAHLILAGQTVALDPVLDVCMFLAGKHDLMDPTSGATHYYAPKGVRTVPAWALTDPAAGRFPQRTITIGDHIFYRKVAF